MTTSHFIVDGSIKLRSGSAAAQGSVRCNRVSCSLCCTYVKLIKLLLRISFPNTCDVYIPKPCLSEHLRKKALNRNECVVEL